MINCRRRKPASHALNNRKTTGYKYINVLIQFAWIVQEKFVTCDTETPSG
jgi:hypothetical protein